MKTLDTSSEDTMVKIKISLLDETNQCFLDLDIPDPSHFRKFKWTDDRLQIIRYENGYVYEGKSDESNNKSGSGKLFNEDRSQYIDGDWKNDNLVQLNFAQLRINETDYFRLNGIDKLITSSLNKFVGRIELKPLDIESGNFVHLQRNLISQIYVSEILCDDLYKLLRTARVNFENVLKKKIQDSITDKHSLSDMHYIYRLQTQKFVEDEDTINYNFLMKIAQNVNLSEDLKDEIKSLLPMEESFINRNKHFPKMNLLGTHYSLKELIQKCVLELISVLKNNYVNMLPSRSFLPSAAKDINNLLNHQVFILHTDDIQLFANLELSTQQISHSNKNIEIEFNSLLTDIIGDLWNCVLTIVKEQPSDNNTENNSVSLTNLVYLQLYKNFIINLHDLCSNYNIKISDTLVKEYRGSITIKSLKNIDANKSEILNRLVFLAKLMNHFKPGYFETKKFPYEFKLFPANSSNLIWKNLDQNSEVSLTNIKDEYLIWLYYIHYCITIKFKNCDKPTDDLFTFVNCLLRIFIKIIKGQTQSYEKLRLLADNIVKFVKSMSSFFFEKTMDNNSDINILIKQSTFMSEFVTNYEETGVDNISNIIDIYQIFWEQWLQFNKETNQKYKKFKYLMEKVEIIKSRVIKIMENSYDLKIYTFDFVVFLRSLNELIKYIKGLNITWFIKRNNASSTNYIKEINKDKFSFEVTNIEKYIEECKSNTLPKHYTLEVIIKVISCVDGFLNDNSWKNDEKIKALSSLLLAIGRSMINFKEQPNYEDYENFLKSSTEPFFRVTKNSKSIQELSKRIASLENFYVYTKELTVMSIDKALEMCENNSKTHSSNSLSYQIGIKDVKLVYEKYMNQFETYIERHISDGFTIEQIVADIKSQTMNKNVLDMEFKYKQDILPKVLAGLSAVWSIMESEDVIEQNQIIKPHCIQIICILRLLAVDQDSKGIESHLAQVLTGQGKSIILGLVAAILALTGNKVLVICYNEYLANRDEEAFDKFFDLFGINDIIHHGTFEDMANELLQPKINGKVYNLRTCIEGLITGTITPSTNDKTTVDIKSSQSILLIDEVDVFFSPQYYGKFYSPVATIESEALADVQIKIWEFALAGHGVKVLAQKVQEYIEIVAKQCKDDDLFIEIFSRSRLILNKHLDIMANDAITVKNGKSTDSFIRKFKINADGLVVYVWKDGRHSTNTYSSYYNIFNYFKLKQNAFDHKGLKNYGYLRVDCGAVSYAMLPKNYPTILGVTGTLTSLAAHEQKAVKSYKISRASDMPSFFGRNKLQFDPIKDFKIIGDVNSWMKEILNDVLKQIQNDRSVLVFFNTEQEVENAKSVFANHVARMNILTGNEDKSIIDHCITEAGVSKNVTLATRRMGRGADFKSNDSVVERKGGVHVIQTFFTEDIKEEIQIKGRTARKDNKGSYQIIVCREHLKKIQYDRTASGANVSNYNQLNNIRTLKTAQLGEKLSQNIIKSRKKHDATMDFLKSLQEYNTSNRHQYFTKYPFIDII